MELFEAIFSRRSIRKFTDQPVSEADLEMVLRAGMQAPSANNHQPWEFLVVKDRGTFAKILEFHPYAKMLAEADACIIVCGNQSKQALSGYLVADCSASIQNMLLALHGLGLGAVWCGLYPRETRFQGVIDLFELPEHIMPIGMIVLGHKAEEKEKEDRFEPQKVHYEKW